MIFTTDAKCSGINLNIYTSKADVYLAGRPGLPDGNFYLRVTDPAGTVLGSSANSGIPTPVSVSNGAIAPCLQLWGALDGFDDTAHPGGEYVVWISDDSSFSTPDTRQDYFIISTD